MSASLQLQHDLWGRSELPTALANMAAAIDSKAAGTTTALLSSSRRPPLVTDGAPLFNVGDLWLAPPGSTQRLFQLADNSVAGTALWTPFLTAGGAPLDLVTGAAAAYGVVKLRQAYAGNCIRVINASAVTLDIPFNASTNMLDTSVLDGHLAGGTGTVDIIYDHTANGLDATQTVAANRPIIALDTINGIRVVTFDSISRGANPALVSKFMNLPVGLSVVPRLACVFAVGNTFYGAQTSTWLTLGPSNDLLCCGNIDSFPGIPCLYCGNISNVIDRADPAVMCWNVNNNVSAVWCNNQTQAGITNGRGGVAVTTGAIGNSATTGFGPGDFMFGAMIIYPTAPTALQITNIRASLMQLFNIPPQIMDTMVAMGDSIDAGQGNTFGRNRHNQSFSLYSIPLRSYNMGISGSVVGPVSVVTSSLARITFVMNTLYNSAIRNFIVSTQAGINDVGGANRTAVATYADMVSLGTTAKSYGTNVKVIACTILPSGITNSNSGGGPNEIQRLALNGMIRGGWKTWADALCDFDANPIMGVATNLAQASLYADGTHPTALGYSYLANQHAAVVNSLLI